MFKKINEKKKEKKKLKQLEEEEHKKANKQHYIILTDLQYKLKKRLKYYFKDNSFQDFIKNYKALEFEDYTSDLKEHEYNAKQLCLSFIKQLTQALEFEKYNEPEIIIYEKYFTAIDISKKITLFSDNKLAYLEQIANSCFEDFIRYRSKDYNTIVSRLINTLKENPILIQSDFIKSTVLNTKTKEGIRKADEIRTILYYASFFEVINREKKGRSYSLEINNLENIKEPVNFSNFEFEFNF